MRILQWIHRFRLIAVIGLLGAISPTAFAQTTLPTAETVRLTARTTREAFATWANRHRSQPPTAAERTEGLRLAQARASAMRHLLETDPGEFARRAMPASDRAALPEQIRDHVERRLAGRGFFGVYCVLPTDQFATGNRPASSAPGGFRREVRVDGITYRAHVFGKWKDAETVQEAAIDGVVLDDAIALGDSPVPTEQADAGSPIPQSSPTTSAPNTVLYMIARFSDQSSDPVSASTALSQMTVLSNFWANNSYGTVSIHGLVQPAQPVDIIYITLPQPSSYAATYNTNFAELLSDARSAASAQNYNYSSYNLDVVVTTSSGFSYAGRAYVGSQGAHLVAGYTSLRTSGHELGHNLGLWHANYWRTDSTAPFGKDSVPGGYCADTSDAEWVEYGHYFSIMAAQSGGEIDDATKPHYAAIEKTKLGWLTGDRVRYVSTSGSYRLYRQDHRDVTNNPRGIRIETSATDYTGNARRYWLNYRYAPWSTAQNWLRSGLQVDVCQSNYGSDGATLLDMTPFSKDAATPFYDPDNQPSSFWTIDNTDKLDGSLVVGRTYSDRVAGIHITPLATGDSGANQEFIDVAVNLGAFPDNTAPVIHSFTTTTNQVAAGQSVSFSVNATDPQGDALAYAWDFDETQVWTASGLNTNTATKSWSSAGQYRVLITVSDMKGGVASDSILVTVGAPSANRQILGRVLWSGHPIGGARVSATLGSATRQAFTESDGSYALTDLGATDGWTLNCRMDTLTFSAQFTNPVSVAGGNAYGKDFYANESLPSPGGTTYSISGQVTDGANGVQGAEVSGGGMLAVTDASGNFTLPNLVNDTYTVIARYANWGFTPASRTVTISGANSIGNTFVRVAPYRITGRFYGPSTSSGAPAPRVYLSNGRSVAATKTSGGNRYWTYTLNSVPAGTYALGAELSGYYIVSTNFTNPLVLNGNLSGINFVATPAVASGAVSGRVTDLGLPLAGVTVEARQVGNLIAAIQTDSDGCFRFSQLTNAAYTIEPTKSGYTFAPNSQTVTSVPAGVLDFAAAGTNSAPEISAISALPNPVAASSDTATLSVTASGQSPLSYSWVALSAPGPVSFSPNDGSEAASTEVAFLRSGDYLIRARVTDADGFSDSTNVTITVSPPPGQMVVTPYEIQLTNGQPATFTVVAWNSQGTPFTVSPEWTVNGGGVIETNGAFVASMPGGPFDVVATAGALVATGTVWVTGVYLPTITLQTLNGQGSEAGGDPIAFRLTRSGDTNVPVTVNLSVVGSASYPTDYSVNGVDDMSSDSATVTFDAGQTTAELIITPMDDAIAEGNEMVSLAVLSAADYYLGPTPSAAATIVDDDAQALLISAASLQVVEGAATDFTVQLQAEPSGNVMVTTFRSEGDLDLAVSDGNSLRFTPTDWNVPQSVTITATEDADVTVGNAVFEVASVGLRSLFVTANEVENDTQFLVVSTNALLVSENGTNQMLVSLNAQPEVELTVLAGLSGDPNLALASPSALVFTTNNWQVPQPVTVFAHDDFDLTNSQALLTLSATNLADVRVTVVETDTDTLHVVVSTNALSVVEAGTNGFTVRLNVQPTNDVAVDMFLGGDTNVVLVATGPLTFTPAGWSVPQAVLLAAVRDENPTNDCATLTLGAPGLTNVVVEVTAVDDAPTVSVQAISDPATEWALLPGAFTITRTGDPSEPLTVHFSLGGSAVEGADYLALTNPLVIPSGLNSLLLAITPIADTLAEGEETVECILLSSAAYALTNTTHSASLTIQDAPIDQWRLQQFTAEELADPDLSSAAADPDHDAIVNLLEYALDLNPKAAETNGSPFATFKERLVLNYRQNKDAVDVTFVVEARDALDAGAWSSDSLIEISRENFGSHWLVSVQDSAYTTNTPARFMRLRVKRP